ncbi:nucleolar protein 16-like [Hydractinia symbiolongicarpus]|uniref:nucleolar protein 16-like n=1 Tax=Hydractinia symbiolongicarpus TaxID=13093 RepID=UPI00254AFC4C|nr:nucleolar protein 16-like [Hydractinia symbiolongicarpus]
MGGIRARKTRRRNTIKILKGTRKRKKTINPAIGDADLKKHWDNTKTLQQNLKGLGLAYDSNEVLRIPKNKKITRKDILKEDREGASMEVEKPIIVNTAVIEAFEKKAANGKKLERHISPGEAKFLLELMKAHGSNYKAMSKDKRNTYQHTPKQLRRKCEGLLNSSLLPKYQELFPDLQAEETMDTL